MQKKTYEYSVKIWALLVCAARERKTFTYGGLAKALGMQGPFASKQDVKEHLGPIMHYCNDKVFPPLTVLVVNQETGVPGKGLKVKGRNADKDMNWHRERVFKKSWLKSALPSASDFQDAAEKAKR